MDIAAVNTKRRQAAPVAFYRDAWNIMLKMDDNPEKTDENKLLKALKKCDAAGLAQLEKDINTEIKNEGVNRADRGDNPGAGWSKEAREENLPQRLLNILMSLPGAIATFGGGKRRSKKRKSKRSSHKKRRTKKRRTKKRRTSARRTRTRRR